MLQVELRLFAGLRAFLPDVGLGESKRWPVEPGTTIAQLIQQVGVPAEEIKVVMVNGRARSVDYTLADGDRVSIFPAVGGG
jgi:molybdopterin synthase sulfur carrier subunit